VRDWWAVLKEVGWAGEVLLPLPLLLKYAQRQLPWTLPLKWFLPLPLPLLLKLLLPLFLNPVERAVTSVRGAGKGAASV